MKTLEFDKEKVKLELTYDEILLMKNALGEVCYGIDIYEFQTRLGFNRENVEKLVSALKKICSELCIEE